MRGHFLLCQACTKWFKAEVAESNVLQAGLQELLASRLWGRTYPFSALEPPCCQHVSLSGPRLSLAIGSLALLEQPPPMTDRSSSREGH